MIQDYPDAWIDEAIRSAKTGRTPENRLVSCRQKMIEIREKNRNAPVVMPKASIIRMSTKDEILTALTIRARDLLGENHKSGCYRK